MKEISNNTLENQEICEIQRILKIGRFPKIGKSLNLKNNYEAFPETFVSVVIHFDGLLRLSVIQKRIVYFLVIFILLKYLENYNFYRLKFGSFLLCR